MSINLLRYAYARLLKTGGEKHMTHYPEKIRRIKEALMELSPVWKNREKPMWTVLPGVPEGSWRRSLRSVRMCGNLHCGGWDFISGSLFISWMLMTMWKKDAENGNYNPFLKNIRWKGSRKRYAGCLQ